MTTKRDYSIGEEIGHSITHGIGVVFSIVGSAILVVLAVQTGDPWRLASAIVYGTSLVLLYTVSTLYHSFPWPRVKKVFQILDHAMIFILIVGTYTPFTLVTLRNSGGGWFFVVVWSIALVGILIETLWPKRPGWLAMTMYLGMGWLAVVMVKPLLSALAPPGVWLLLAGGLSYTVGTIAYVSKRVPYLHMVWHLFVFAGTILHFLAIAIYVI